jgi:hypothetical protein
MWEEDFARRSPTHRLRASNALRVESGSFLPHDRGSVYIQFWCATCVPLRKISANRTVAGVFLRRLTMKDSISVLLFALIVVTGHTAHAQSLTETVEWINQTSKDHGLFQQWDRNGVLQVEYVEEFSLNQCQMTHSVHALPDAAMSKSMYTASNTTTFDLKEIDPSTVEVVAHAHLFMSDCTSAVEVKANKLDCSVQAEVRFRARNDNPAIAYESTTIFPELKGKDHERRDSGKDNSSAFSLWDTAYADRFAKAFRHAVELCGGKKSAF